MERSAEENQAITSLKGSSRAPDVVDVGPSFAIQGAAQGLYASYKVSEWASIPASLRDPKGRWTGDYWGAISIGYNSKLVNPAPTSFKDLMNPAYKGQVALNGSPLTSDSAVAGVFAAALANGGSLSNVAPGVDFFGKLKSSGNFITVAVDPSDRRVGADPDLDRLGLPEPRLRQGVSRRQLEGDRAVRRRLRLLLRPGDQRPGPEPVGWHASGRSSCTRTRVSCSGSRASRTRSGSRTSRSGR